ncbi:hypothetical protein GGR92_001407 [Spirosoma lacussanchae]
MARYSYRAIHIPLIFPDMNAGASHRSYSIQISPGSINDQG